MARLAWLKPHGGKRRLRRCKRTFGTHSQEIRYRSADVCRRSASAGKAE
jgi:hypothetical protein